MKGSNRNDISVDTIPQDWGVVPFPLSLSKEMFTEKDHIQQNAFGKAGRYPIVDQGSSLIAGFTDDESLVHKDGLPVVVFGDHTRIFKYVDFPFALGADGTKVLRPDPERFHPKFYYYCLTSLKMPNRGYNRHFKYLKERSVPQPPLLEQKKIAAILTEIQQTIDVQEKTIERTKELKKAFMAELFTRGLHGEELKETEIGMKPKSWGVERLGELTTVVTKGSSPRWQGFHYVNEGITFIRSQNIEWGRLNLANTLQLPKSFNEKEKRSIVKKSDVLINLVGASIGRVAVATDEIEGANLNQAVAIARLREGSYVPFFLMYFLLSPEGQRQIRGQVKEVARANVSLQDVKNFLVPYPMIGEQQEIANLLEEVELKISTLEGKQAILQSLFISMLHQLMTGQIRVMDLQLPA